MWIRGITMTNNVFIINNWETLKGLLDSMDAETRLEMSKSVFQKFSKEFVKPLLHLENFAADLKKELKQSVIRDLASQEIASELRTQLNGFKDIIKEAVKIEAQLQIEEIPAMAQSQFNRVFYRQLDALIEAKILHQRKEIALRQKRLDDLLLIKENIELEGDDK